MHHRRKGIGFPKKEKTNKCRGREFRAWGGGILSTRGGGGGGTGHGWGLEERGVEGEERRGKVGGWREVLEGGDGCGVRGGRGIVNKGMGRGGRERKTGGGVR